MCKLKVIKSNKNAVKIIIYFLKKLRRLFILKIYQLYKVYSIF